MTPTPQQLGMIFPVAYGIQIDLCAVIKKGEGMSVTHGSMCDHNCTTDVGGYDCPAAITVNKGFKPVFANKASIVNQVRNGREGLRLHFQSPRGDLNFYYNRFMIPPEVREALQQSIAAGLCEVNLFGGNPEMHPEVLEIITELKAEGFRVNLTTTGRKFLTSAEFVKGFAKNPPHLLALSADDFDPNRLEELFSMSLEDLKKAWKKINPLHGQEQKFYEGVYAARLIKEQNIPCAVLFNMVLYPGNLKQTRTMIDTIAKYLPQALVNPYPGQDSFQYGDGNIFDEESLSQFSELVDWFIQETKNANPNLTKRLQYWLVMKTVLQRHAGHTNAASQLISGHHIWKCYQNQNAATYLQIGKGSSQWVQIEPIANVQPGGFAGCYWNSSTVTGMNPIRNSDDVLRHLNFGTEAYSASSERPCPGCSMPRLWFNMMTTELGLNPGLVDSYLELRKEHAGF